MPARRKAKHQTQESGSYNASRHADRSLKLAPGTPEPPDWLEDHAAAIFRRSVGLMERAQILAPADADLVAHYACVQARFEADPASFNAAMLGQLRLLRAEVGLTPQGRLRIEGKPPDDADPAEEFFH